MEFWRKEFVIGPLKNYVNEKEENPKSPKSNSILFTDVCINLTAKP